MDLRETGFDYELSFDPRDDTRPLVEACNETVAIFSGNIPPPEEGRPKATLDFFLLMGRVAQQASLRGERLIPLTADELGNVKQALANFSSVDFIERAIHADIDRTGVMSNPRIAKRILLGQAAGSMLTEILARESSILEPRDGLDDDAAAQTLVA